MNIVILGMMGSSKDLVAKALAKKFEMDFADTDQMIEKDHGRITDIYKKYGEEHFRKLETEKIEKLAGVDNHVINTGAGVIINKKNIILLRKNSKVIYLNASVDYLFKNISVFDKWLLKKNDKEVLRLILKDRTARYLNSCDVVINMDGKKVDDVVKEICGLINISKENE